MTEDDARELLVQLVAIRAVLERMDARQQEQVADVGRCPHGLTGLCMYCEISISNDLLRAKTP